MESNVVKLAEILSREGKGHLSPFELGFIHIMNLYLAAALNSQLKYLHILPLYILTNLDMHPPNLFSRNVIGLYYIKPNVIIRPGSNNSSFFNFLFSINLYTRGFPMSEKSMMLVPKFK